MAVFAGERLLAVVIEEKSHVRKFFRLGAAELLQSHLAGQLFKQFKKSSFDYIIFDMPHLHQTSPTWGMAAFMDKFLLVVEAEKSTRDVVKRSFRRLKGERENVSVVVNKARSFGPKALDLDN